MVFTVNPTAVKSFDAFQAAAKASSGTGGYGSPSSSGTTGTASSSTPSAQATGGATRHSGSAAIVLAIVGIGAGVLL